MDLVFSRFGAALLVLGGVAGGIVLMRGMVERKHPQNRSLLLSCGVFVILALVWRIVTHNPVVGGG